jgi:hypothetical protein
MLINFVLDVYGKSLYHMGQCCHAVDLDDPYGRFLGLRDPDPDPDPSLFVRILILQPSSKNCEKKPLISNVM